MVSIKNIGSKTIWGFGLAIILGLAQTFGIAADPGVLQNTVDGLQAIFAIIGIWGARDAVR